jgi:hypothetical protein
MEIYEEIRDENWTGVWELHHGNQYIQFYNEYRARAHFHKVLDNAELWYLDEDEIGPVAELVLKKEWPIGCAGIRRSGAHAGWAGQPARRARQIDWSNWRLPCRS